MKLNSAGDMQFALSGKICLMSFLRRVESAKKFILSIEAYLCAKLAAAYLYTKKTGFVITAGFFEVLRVFRTSCVTKICNAIIVTDHVDVVNISSRPNTVNIKPCESMSFILSIFDEDIQIPTRGVKISSRASGNSHTAPYAPCKNAGELVIIKKLAQTFLSKCRIISSHDTPFSLIGEIPACVERTCGYRYCITGVS